MRKEELAGHLREGFLFVATARHEEAEELFAQALELAPDSVEAVAGLALSLVARGKPDVLPFLDEHRRPRVACAAIERLYWMALEQNGRESEAAALQAELGPPETALDYLMLGLQKMLGSASHLDQPEMAKEAFADFGRAIDRSEQARPVHYYMRILAAANANLGEEMNALAEAVQRFWPDAPHSWEWLAMALDRSEPQRALAFYEKAVDRRPDDAFLHAAIGRLCVKGHDFDRGEAAFERAIELNPKNAALRLGSAMVRFLRNDPEGVRERCEDCLNGEIPLSAVDYRTLGVMYHRLGDADKAREVFERGAREHPTVGELRRDIAHAYGTLGRHDEALPYLRQACEMLPDHAAPFGTLGRALLRANKLDEAVRVWRTYVSLAPTDGDGHFQLTLALFRAERFAECVDAAGKSLEIRANHAPSHHLLGLAHLESGDAKKARTHLSRALELESTSMVPDYRRRAKAWLEVPADYDRAVLVRRILVAHDHDDAVAHEELVAALRRSGDHGGLRAELDRWVYEREDSAESWRELADYLLEPDLPEQWHAFGMAVFAADKAVGLTGRKDAKLLALLAKAHHKKGDAKAAAATAAEALAAIPADADEKLRGEIERRVAPFK